MSEGGWQQQILWLLRPEDVGGWGAGIILCSCQGYAGLCPDRPKGSIQEYWFRIPVPRVRTWSVGSRPCMVFGLLSVPCLGRLGSSLPSFRDKVAMRKTPLTHLSRSFLCLKPATASFSKPSVFRLAPPHKSRHHSPLPHLTPVNCLGRGSLAGMSSPAQPGPKPPSEVLNHWPEPHPPLRTLSNTIVAAHVSWAL